MRVNWWFAGATFFLCAVGMAFLAGRASVKREAYQLVLRGNAAATDPQPAPPPRR